MRAWYESVDRENKLNRNAYSVLIVMKHSLTCQNFQKSKLPLFRELNFLKKDLFRLIREPYGYLIFLSCLTI